MLDFLIEYGYFGMFVSALLAGSVLPFSSEVVMAGLQAAGSDPMSLLVWGTLGNFLGSCINYGLGTLGRDEWIVKYAHVSPEQLERGKGYVNRYGPYAGLLSWIPLLGSLITVSLGYLRANVWLTMLCILVGKVIRYWIVLFVVGSIAG